MVYTATAEADTDLVDTIRMEYSHGPVDRASAYLSRIMAQRYNNSKVKEGSMFEKLAVPPL